MTLRKVRESTGLGLREAAAELGASASQLSEWETGKVSPGTRTLVKLSRFLTQKLGRPVSLDELLPDDNAPATPAAS